MKIKLYDLEIENFKGIKRFGLVADGCNIVIKAENGIGKTTIYDAFLWALFGKNSEGVSQFGIVPCDKDNKAIRGIVVCVEASLDLDGKKVVIKKEMHEKVVKKQLTGYTNYYWINDVPKKEKDFAEYIKEKLVAEDIFKMLTDLTYFNGKMHWKERRSILMEIAGAVEVTDYDELMELVGEDRTIDEYKKILTDRKKLEDDDRKTIGPRIDENQKSLEDYATEKDTTKDAETRRNELNADIGKLEEQRKELIDGENIRQQQIQTMNDLKLKRDQREAELKNDDSAVQDLIAEKEAITAKVMEASQEVTRLEGVCNLKRGELENAKLYLDRKTNNRDALSAEKKAIESAELNGKCPLADQMCDVAKNVDSTDNQDKIDKIDKQGKALFAAIKADRAVIEKTELAIAEATDTHLIAQTNYKRFTEEKFKRFEEIDVKIKNKPRPLPERDDAWAALEKQIFDIGKALGKPPVDQLAEIEGKRTELSAEVKVLDKTLANADNITTTTARIKELGEQEKELSQKIADIEKQLAEIAEYKKSESQQIEEAVNDKFEHTTFKLFDYRLNGEINPTCIATYEGVDYGDLSTGQQITVGMDIVNVLSEHYKTSVVLFIDHLESLTLPVIAKTQVIGLFAEKGVKELKIEVEAPEKE